MTRRIASATVLVLASVVFLANAAEAITSRTKACIKVSKDARKACVIQCGQDFQTNFSSCFGPGTLCASQCLAAQTNCLTDPISGRAACQKDTDPIPSSGRGQCAVKQRDALQCCADSQCPADQKLDPDPTVCASKARLAGLACVQDCQTLYAPAIQECNAGLNDCIGACASCRNRADCPGPQ